MKKLICFWLIFIFCSFVFAQTINFNISTDRQKIVLGDSLYISLNFQGTQDIKAPKLSSIAGFNSQYAGPATSVRVINGKMFSSVSHHYLLTALKTGIFNIGPFTVSYKGKIYNSNQLAIEVIDRSAASSNSSLNSSKAENLKDKVFIVIEPSKREVSLNEKFKITVKLYANGINLRFSQNSIPVLVHDGFSFSRFSQPRQYKDILHGVYYYVVEFIAEGFPTKAGELTLGPANLECYIAVKQKRQSRVPNLGEFDNLFNDDFSNNLFGKTFFQPINLNAEPIIMIVSPSTGKNKPVNLDSEISGLGSDI